MTEDKTVKMFIAGAAAAAGVAYLYKSSPGFRDLVRKFIDEFNKEEEEEDGVEEG